MDMGRLSKIRYEVVRSCFCNKVICDLVHPNKSTVNAYLI